jgi:hypothetical protein
MPCAGQSRGPAAQLASRCLADRKPALRSDRGPQVRARTRLSIRGCAALVDPLGRETARRRRLGPHARRSPATRGVAAAYCHSNRACATASTSDETVARDRRTAPCLPAKLRTGGLRRAIRAQAPAPAALAAQRVYESGCKPRIETRVRALTCGPLFERSGGLRQQDSEKRVGPQGRLGGWRRASGRARAAPDGRRAARRSPPVRRFAAQGLTQSTTDGIPGRDRDDSTSGHHQWDPGSSPG